MEGLTSIGGRWQMGSLSKCLDSKINRMPKRLDSKNNLRGFSLFGAAETIEFYFILQGGAADT